MQYINLNNYLCRYMFRAFYWILLRLFIINIYQDVFISTCITLTLPERVSTVPWSRTPNLNHFDQGTKNR